MTWVGCVEKSVGFGPVVAHYGMRVDHFENWMDTGEGMVALLHYEDMKNGRIYFGLGKCQFEKN